MLIGYNNTAIAISVNCYNVNCMIYVIIMYTVHDELVHRSRKRRAWGPLPSGARGNIRIKCGNSANGYTILYPCSLDLIMITWTPGGKLL